MFRDITFFKHPLLLKNDGENRILKCDGYIPLSLSERHLNLLLGLTPTDQTESLKDKLARFLDKDALSPGSYDDDLRPLATEG